MSMKKAMKDFEKSRKVRTVSIEITDKNINIIAECYTVDMLVAIKELIDVAAKQSGLSTVDILDLLIQNTLNDLQKERDD